MYERVEGVVRLDGKLFNAFLMERGVKQRDSLSPLLFISFMDEVLKTCKRRTERTRVGYWNMRPVYCQGLLYADDIVLIADSEEKLQETVIEWTEILRGKGMAVNEMRRKVMRVCRIGDQVGNLHTMCNNIELEQTTSFEYLGTIIHQNGKIEEEALNCVRKTNNIYYQLNQTIFDKKEINTKTKLQVIEQ
jgi:hypothetical protein